MTLASADPAAAPRIRLHYELDGYAPCWELARELLADLRFAGARLLESSLQDALRDGITTGHHVAGSCGIGRIVAPDLRVCRFTPMAEKKFNLIPSDIGRPFSQISTTLQCAELPGLITETIDTVAPVERTVQDHKGDTYLLRIRPYKTPDNRIDGAVIALFDLNTAKK